MSLFRTIVFVAAVAGALAGIALTALQQARTVPLILKAETFETKATPAPAGATEHKRESWMPADGVERIAYTALANIVGGIGLALLLVALGEIAGGIGTWRQGVFWGIGGFVAFTLAPTISLPPELPGMPSADLIPRQVWWGATVALTAGGIALVAFGKAVWMAALGVALIVAPHLIGAPRPESATSPVPHELAQSFVAGVVITSFLFWVLLGGFAGYMRSRLHPT